METTNISQFLWSGILEWLSRWSGLGVSPEAIIKGSPHLKVLLGENSLPSSFMWVFPKGCLTCGSQILLQGVAQEKALNKEATVFFIT